MKKIKKLINLCTSIKMKKIIAFMSFLIICTYSILPVVTSGKITGNNLYVGGNQQGNYSRIQDAIDNASEGDTITVFNGMYNENIILNKSINLIGEDKYITIINGRINDNVITLTANQVKITGFTIQHSGDKFPHAGINVTSDNNNISGNILINNFYGMTLFSASNNIISENIISNNDQCGIYMTDSSNNIITRNTIENHNFNGIGMYQSSNTNTITDNLLTHNDYCGINIGKSASNEIIGNSITDNNIGIRIPSSEYQNQISNNDFSNNKNDYTQAAGFPTFEFIIVAVSLILMTAFILFWKEKNTPSSKDTRHSLDARGNPCPIPLIMTKKKISKIAKGEILEIITADIVAKENIERYARDNYDLIRIDKKGELFKIYIKNIG